MCVMNDIDRFHLVTDVIDRVSGLVSRAAYAKQALREKLIDHRPYIRRYGDGDQGLARGSGTVARRATSTARDNL
jgi:xylulose-5-phosphate/fructose-6-phosphate phosphoketolase